MNDYLRPTLLIVTACLFALISGCIEAEPTMIIKEDASGVFDLAYSIPEQTVIQFKAMTKLRDDLNDAADKPSQHDDPLTLLFFDPSEEGFRSEFQKLADKGITIEKISLGTRNAARQVNIRLKFRKLSDVLATDICRQYRISLSKDDQGNYTLKREGINTTNTNELYAKPEQEMVTPILAGFRVLVKINTPSLILKTNASRTSRFTAEWEFNFDKNLNAVVDLQSKPMEVTFSSEGLSL